MDFNNNSKAIYLQIADDICDKILTGIYEADCRIPSVREYAADVAVNVNTVMRAYDHLASQEIIYNKRGLGYYISPDGKAKVIDIRRKEMFGEGLPTVFRRLKMINVTPSDLADMYNKFLEEQ